MAHAHHPRLLQLGALGFLGCKQTPPLQKAARFFPPHLSGLELHHRFFHGIIIPYFPKAKHPSPTCTLCKNCPRSCAPSPWHSTSKSGLGTPRPLHTSAKSKPHERLKLRIIVILCLYITFGYLYIILYRVPSLLEI